MFACREGRGSKTPRVPTSPTQPADRNVRAPLQERRKELSKTVAKMGEDAKVRAAPDCDAHGSKCGGGQACSRQQ